MREEKTLQAEKSGGVDESGIETEQLELPPSLHRPAPQISVQCKSRYSDGNPLALSAEPRDLGRPLYRAATPDAFAALLIADAGNQAESKLNVVSGAQGRN